MLVLAADDAFYSARFKTIRQGKILMYILDTLLFNLALTRTTSVAIATIKLQCVFHARNDCSKRRFPWLRAQLFTSFLVRYE